MSYPYESNTAQPNQPIISSALSQDNSLVKDINSTSTGTPALVSVSVNNMSNENFVAALGHLSNMPEVGMNPQSTVFQNIPQNSGIVTPLFNQVIQQNQAIPSNLVPSLAQSTQSQPISTNISQYSAHTVAISNPLIASGGLNVTASTLNTAPSSVTTSTVGKTNLKVEDALTYLDLVKARFSDKNAIYMDFLDVMREFKAQTIDTYTVIMRVRQLFDGHKDLIDGFNTFLPTGYRMDTPLPPMVSSTSETVTTFTSGSHPSVHQPSVSINSLVTAGVRLPGVQTPNQNLNNSQQFLSIGSISNLSTAATGNSIPSNSSLSQSLSEGAPSLLRAPILSNIQQTVATPQLPQNSTINRSAAATQNVSTPSYQTSANAAGDMLMAMVPGQSSLLNTAANISPAVNTPTSINLLPPTEFNHAISYVNKIKNRFQNQPEVYKRFLEILHWYQKEQRNPDPQLRKSTEREVYQEVAKLFKGQEDLLIEFNQFLPDATGVPSSMTEHDRSRESNRKGNAPYLVGSGDTSRSNLMSGSTSRNLSSGPEATKVKRSSMEQEESGSIISTTASRLPPTKKMKTQRDVSLAEIGQVGTSQDYAFFNKVRKSFKHSKNFESFLQLIELYNRSLINEEELIGQIERMLRPYPELVSQMRDMLGLMPSNSSGMSGNVPSAGLAPIPGSNSSLPKAEASDSGEKLSIMNSGQLNRPKDRSLTANGSGADHRYDLDLVHLEKCGISYRMLPKDFPQPKCSGRINNPICQQVLNDIYVSFSSMSSEDSQFVTSKKSALEENVYRVEDERYEVDMVVELNRAAIANFVAIQKKMDKMSPEDLQRFQLDEHLGGSSAILQKKAIQRIYGDKVNDIKLGLMRSPSVAVPLVLARLREKDEEWKQSLKKFHRNWREQDGKYYLKSLDHQGLTFKQKDMPNLRSKTLINHIESLAEENPNGDFPFADDNNSSMSWRNIVEKTENCHIALQYSDNAPLEDAATLIIHHVKRQSSSSKEDKREMKSLIRGPLQDLLHSTRFPLSDDEEEEDAKEEEQIELMPPLDDKKENSLRQEKTYEDVDRNIPDDYLKNIPPYEYYNLFYASSSWYVFLRLHHILCERLVLLRNLGEKMAGESLLEAEKHPESARAQVAEVLRLKKACEFGPSQYYKQALSYVRDLLDGGDDSQTFEDRMRDLFGIHAYPWFTMDKLIQSLVRQLQILVSEDVSRQLISLYRLAAVRGGTGGSIATADTRFLKEKAYYVHAAKINGNQNLFRIIIFKHSQKVLMTLLKPTSIKEPLSEAEGIPVDIGKSVCSDSIVVRNWRTYLARYSSLEAIKCESSSVDNAAMEALTGCVTQRVGSPVFLIKSVRSYLLQLAQSILERKRMNLVGDVELEKLKVTDDYNEDVLAHLNNCLAEVDDDNDDDNDDDDISIIKNDIKEETTEDNLSYDKTIDTTTDVAECKTKVCTTSMEDELSTQSEIARKQRVSQVKNWQTDTCDLLRDVFKLTLPRKELFRDTLCTDCMKAKNWSGKYRISWSAGSYGIFIRKNRACKLSSQSKNILQKKSQRFKDHHIKWIEDNCDPDNVRLIDNWLSDVSPVDVVEMSANPISNTECENSSILVSTNDEAPNPNSNEI